MKFLHTSDWHIGRQFHNVSLLNDQAVILDGIIDLLKKHQCDALVIAGDLYDRSVPPAAAVALLDETFHRIGIELAIPILLIPGNHDSSERLRFAARQLRQAGLYIFGDLHEVATPVRLTGQSGVSVNFYGIPYNDPEQVRFAFENPDVKTHNDAHSHLLSLINQDLDQQANNVLISHCFVDGAEPSESERPLSIGGADRVDFKPMEAFDYVALGHLHSPQYRGAEHIRYSGSPMKYSFSEVNQKKGATLVTVTEDGKVEHEHLPLTATRDMRVIEGKMEQILEAGAKDQNKDDYLLIRLQDTHAILDAMGKLRAVYPNVLHLEKPGLMQAINPATLNREKLKRSELAMFSDFFEQTTGNAVTEPQKEALQTLIDGLHRTANNG